MTDTIQPHPFAFPDAALDDLRERLSRTRWPDRETVDDWSQGAPLARMQALCDYWRDGYDWRACEARLNALEPSMTRIDGLDIHFLHLRSPEPDATPLVMTHGWPGSVIEFLKVAPLLADPRARTAAIRRTPFTSSYPRCPASDCPRNRRSPAGPRSGSRRHGSS